MLRDEASFPSSVALGGVDGTWVRYWDETSTIAMLEFKVAQPAQTAPAAAKEKKVKKKTGKHLAVIVLTCHSLRTSSFQRQLVLRHQPHHLFCQFQINPLC